MNRTLPFLTAFAAALLLTSSALAATIVVSAPLWGTVARSDPASFDVHATCSGCTSMSVSVGGVSLLTGTDHIDGTVTISIPDGKSATLNFADAGGAAPSLRVDVFHESAPAFVEVDSLPTGGEIFTLTDRWVSHQISTWGGIAGGCEIHGYLRGCARDVMTGIWTGPGGGCESDPTYPDRYGVLWETGGHYAQHEWREDGATFYWDTFGGRVVELPRQFRTVSLLRLDDETLSAKTS